jgi:hypothetical protein
MATGLISQEVVRGSDYSFTMIWNDPDGDPLDFTGYSLSFFDESNNIEDRLSGEITDPAAGTIVVSIEGSPPLPLGLHSFRVLLTEGSSTKSSKRLYIKVV